MLSDVAVSGLVSIASVAIGSITTLAGSFLLNHFNKITKINNVKKELCCDLKIWMNKSIHLLELNDALDRERKDDDPNRNTACPDVYNMSILSKISLVSELENDFCDELYCIIDKYINICEDLDVGLLYESAEDLGDKRYYFVSLLVLKCNDLYMRMMRSCDMPYGKFGALSKYRVSYLEKKVKLYDEIYKECSSCDN